MTPTSPASRLERVSLLPAVATLLLTAYLCVGLLTERYEMWVWPKSSGTIALAIVWAWLGLALGSIVLGFVALVRRHRHQGRIVLAILLGAASLLTVAVMVVAAVTSVAGPRHASDRSLIENFHHHESDFALLPAEVSAGRQLDGWRLRALNVNELERDQGDSLFLYVSRWGIVPSGNAKGYYHSSKPPRPLLDDLDHAGPLNGFVYRHIAGPWYLFYEEW